MNRIGSLAILLGVVLLLFSPYFTRGKMPIAADIPVGMYYPWLNESYGYAVRPPVKNALLSDTVSQFWIWRNWGIEGLKKHQIYSWNSHSLSGYEMSPWFHTITFSPLNIFYMFLTTTQAMSWVVISQILISLTACFFLGVQLFKNNLAAIGLSIVWSMSSFFVGWLTWGTVSGALALLPLSLYLLEKRVSSGVNYYSFLIIVTLSLLIFTGHPQTVLYCLLMYFVWSYCRSGLSYTAKTIALAILVSSIAIYPSISVVTDSIRGLDDHLVSVNFGFIPLSKLTSLLFSANFFGNPATGNYFGGDYNFQEKLVNFGIVPAYLTLYALIRIAYLKKINSVQKMSALFIITGILLSTQYPLGWLVYKLHIPLISSSPAGRSFIFTIFGASILFADTLLQFSKNKIHRKSLTASSLIMVFGFVALFMVLLMSRLYITHLPGSVQDNYLEFLNKLNISIRNLLVPFAIFTSSTLLIWIFVFTKKFPSLVVGILILLLFSEQFLFFKKYTPFVESDLYFPKTSSLSYISDKYLESPDFFRVERESAEILPPNMWEVFGFYSTSGYDPVAPQKYNQYLSQIGLLDRPSRYMENAGDKTNLLSSLGVKYLLTIKRDEKLMPSSEGEINKIYDSKQWQEVYQEGPVAVLENNFYHPPYNLTSTSSGSLELANRWDGYWKFHVDTSNQNTLVLMENSSKNWSVKINGEVGELVSFQNTFKSVNLHPGNSDVEFIYFNKDLLIGSYLSLLGVILSILFIKNKLLY